MSIRVMSWVWDQRSLSPRDKFILLSMADYARDDGNGIWPSVATLSKKTGYDTRTVQRATNDLEERGLLVKVGESKYQTNRWRINIEWLDVGGDSVTPPPCQAATPPPGRLPPNTLVEPLVKSLDPPPPVEEEEEILELTTAEVDKVGMGSGSSYRGACPAVGCDNDISWDKVNDVTECINGHTIKLVKRRASKRQLYDVPVRKPVDMTRSDYNILKAASLQAVNMSKVEAGRTIQFRGFRKREQYEQFKGLILDSQDGALRSWSLWLDFRFREGKRGHNLVYSALQGLEWAAGGPPFSREKKDIPEEKGIGEEFATDQMV